MGIKNDISKATGLDRSGSTDSLEDFLNKRTGYQTKLEGRDYGFQTVIDNFVINSQARLLDVVAQSIANVIQESQVPVAKGGKMRVKTGFLRASGIASLNAPPVGPTKGDPKGIYTSADDYDKAPSINNALARMKIGDVFFFGWTAHYAKYREAHDGFLETALQKWQSHVDKAVQYFRDKDSRK